MAAILSPFGSITSGSYLCAPNSYAPASITSLTATTTTMAAWSSGSVCTNVFTAPVSGSVVVTLSCLAAQSVGGDLAGFALAAKGTVTPLFGNVSTVQLSANNAPLTVVFYVTGLTPGTSYQFDLLGCVTAASTATIKAQGQNATNLVAAGAPVVMTVQAVLLTTAPLMGTDNAAPWVTVNANAGPLGGFRGYNPPVAQIPAAWPGTAAGPVPGQVAPSGVIISLYPTLAAVLAGTYDAAITAFAASAPSGSYLTFWHEGETGAQYTVPNLIAAHQHVYPLVKAANPGLLYGQVFSGASSYSGQSGFPLSQWIASGLDWYGCDTYPVNGTDNTSIQLGLFESNLATAGVPAATPLSVPEFNSVSATGIAQETWYPQVWSHVIFSQRAYRHVMSWWGTGDPDWVWPPDAAGLIQLQAYATASRSVI
jgi:hypothetical protein